ncbi:hypothetical protein N9M22_06325 [Litoricolaceae bacterium]|nr:hypothetical protein [Litorivicinaceae bacterium]
MGTTIRLTSLVLTVAVFGLKPTEVRSLDTDPINQLSFWHPADQVPCRMYLFTTEGCECVTVFEEIHISGTLDH